MAGDVEATREERNGDVFASYLTWAGIVVMISTNWLIVFMHGPTSFKWFTFHLLLQPVALACFSYGILTLQPTSRPHTKAAGLERHQTATLAIGFPLMALGTSAIFLNKYMAGSLHYQTWHAKFGLACMIWIFTQLCVGAGSTWYNGALFGGGTKAKVLWKYHRLSGYALFGMLLLTSHLGGQWSTWGHNYTSNFVRFASYTLSPALIGAGIYLRVRPSKMKLL